MQNSADEELLRRAGIGWCEKRVVNRLIRDGNILIILEVFAFRAEMREVRFIQYCKGKIICLFY